MVWLIPVFVPLKKVRKKIQRVKVNFGMMELAET
jgi:hypothetical protein